MKLSVSVLGREVATLEPQGDFKSVMTYHPDAKPQDFVSLTMPVRTESYTWDDQLPPVLQMNLPEGYLLQVLQEQFGPHITGSSIALLSVIGRNMVGRLQVATPGAQLDRTVQTIELAHLLRGDNSEAAFAELVKAHATSGVSGVVPKFLDAQESPATAAEGFKPHKKSSMITRQHIIKGSNSHLPFVALNEHLCMQVASRVIPTATTQVSDDGHALVVHRFDVDANGQPLWGMEDFCSLMGLRPSAKYDTTWERVAKAVRDHVPAAERAATFGQLASMLFLTYALRNADCHSKNLALRYTSYANVQLCPAYDMLTTSAYPAYKDNPPGLSFMGKKTWEPGKNLQKFVNVTFGVGVKEQSFMIEAICDAIADVGHQVRETMATNDAFRDVGKRMLLAWQEGVGSLRDRRMYALGDWVAVDGFAEFSPPNKQAAPRNKIGHSELLGKR